MTLEELKREKSKLILEQASQKAEYELTTSKLQVVTRIIQEECPHKLMTGLLIKCCHNCGKVDFFWKF